MIEINLSEYKNYCIKHNNRDVTCGVCNENRFRNYRIDAENLMFNNIIREYENT